MVDAVTKFQSIQVMITIEGPRLGIDLGTSTPKGEHANHYTNRDRKNHISDPGKLW